MVIKLDLRRRRPAVDRFGGVWRPAPNCGSITDTFGLICQ